MAAIVAYELADGSRRYYVKYRDAAHRQHKKSGFRTKRAAQDYAARMETSITDGTWVNPAKGQTTVNELAVTWLQGKQGVSKPKYYADLESAWNVHVQPKWGVVPYRPSVDRKCSSGSAGWQQSVAPLWCCVRSP